jgi:hypothetical protein
LDSNGNLKQKRKRKIERGRNLLGRPPQPRSSAAPAPPQRPSPAQIPLHLSSPPRDVLVFVFSFVAGTGGRQHDELSHVPAVFVDYAKVVDRGSPINTPMSPSVSFLIFFSSLWKP